MAVTQIGPATLAVPSASRKLSSPPATRSHRHSDGGSHSVTVTVTDASPDACSKIGTIKLLTTRLVLSSASWRSLIRVYQDLY